MADNSVTDLGAIIVTLQFINGILVSDVSTKMFIIGPTFGVKSSLKGGLFVG